MKKLILIFLSIFYGCNSNENQIENIEMMSYYYKPSENYETQILDYLHYSIIDEYGSAETIKKIDNTGNNYVKFKSVVNQELLNEICRINIKLSNKFYENKKDENVAEIYCGPISRVKIKFKDNHIITLSYYNKKDNSKYLLFMKLFNNLENNFSNKKYSVIDKNDLTTLLNKQKIFEKYTINKDTLNLVFPRMPKKIDQVKFIKE